MKYLLPIKSNPIVALFVLIISVLAFYSCKEMTPVKKEILLPKGQQGKIVFDNKFHEFGKVTEGDIVKHTFVFKNEGPGPVKIINTKTSCGCTTAEAALKEYAPGESGEMAVTIDTLGKKGIVVKTVTVFMENGQAESMDLTMLMHLEPPPHPKVENVLIINTDPSCKVCHLDKGVGQKGVFLYHRICSQCHGKKGKGASARALNDTEWLKGVDDTYLNQVIANGLPTNGMPPYVQGVDPPLTREQLTSLIEYIRSLSKSSQKTE